MLTRLFDWFKITRALNLKIAEFNNNLLIAGDYFKKAIFAYLENGISPEFEDNFLKVRQIETKNDTLRREIETNLFSYTLIPESRGDVLTLIENLDKILNKYEVILLNFSIEKPLIPKEYYEDFKDIAEASVMSVNTLANSSKAFFKNITEVKKQVYNISFFQKECEKLCTSLKQALFKNNNIELIHKTQIRNFSNAIDDIANSTIKIADKLIIFTVKRVV